MNDPWFYIGWGVIIVVVTCVVWFFFGFFKAIFAQLRADAKRRKAHAGKLKCEGGEWVRIYGDERNQVLSDKKYIKCPFIATRVTPNGYYCEEHWLENSRKTGGLGAAVISWGHKLNHTVKASA